ncbi:hypothetical protein N7456_012688 [Penicillium angulare]|uniref:Mannosyltransferase n=1 Tax=Penicillium angulare TaxID=116970 RepID=A0A9W9EKB1_9EURO|nr:hypothetical protein N7456_012688 [Penicillium angulare]
MPPPSSSRRRVAPAATGNILLFLIALRLVNAFTVRTFFQPDEFFQSLEPAWQIAFGKDQGAWLTWEWRHQLRSSLHPLLFAAIYKLIDSFASLLHLSPSIRAEFLIAAPKTAQAVISATSDYYTWKLANRVYGEDSRGALATLLATIFNPWQWFCSTRTLSNCLETSLTVGALYFWPWHWSITTNTSENGARPKTKRDGHSKTPFGIRKCLSLAAFACILRPTNIIIWATLAAVVWFQCCWARRIVFVREAIVCGLVILAISAIADRLFYGFWTFPPLRFLYFNIAQSLAIFYGRNDWHYYASQGYPLLLTTLIPFAVSGLYFTLTTRVSSASDKLQTAIRVQLAIISLLMPFVLSLISHKEVRFIYPILPALHILAAPRLVQTFWPALTSRSNTYTPRRLAFICLILTNVFIAVYTSSFHASGPSRVLAYLRGQYETHSLVNQNGEYTADPNSSLRETGITAGFLMPCHSTPWRSHMIYPSLNAWALSCEPPIDMDEGQKAVYRDEADQFYDNPSQFLRQNMAGGLRHLPRRPSYSTESQSLSPSNPPLHEWPDYLVFFAQLEPTMQSLLRGSSYGECWRTWNTHWHDDWRRHGDIVVWCLDPVEQDSWRLERSETRRREHHNQDHQFDRVLNAIKAEAARQQKQGWFTKLSKSFSWPSSSSWLPFQTSKRSSLWPFSRKSSSRWPWDQPFQIDTALAKFGWKTSRWQYWTSHWQDWMLSWPEWLGGPVRRKISKKERDLWQ